MNEGKNSQVLDYLICKDFVKIMKLGSVCFMCLIAVATAKTDSVSQAKFFRLLGIKPTEQEATSFGGLNPYESK